MEDAVRMAKLETLNEQVKACRKCKSWSVIVGKRLR